MTSMTIGPAMFAPVRQLPEEVGEHLELHGDSAGFDTSADSSSDSWIGAWLAHRTPENRGAVVATHAPETGN